MTETWETSFPRLANQVIYNMQTKLSSGAERAPIVRLTDALLEHVAEIGASDLHIEPRKDGLHFRYRVDGLLREDSRSLPPVLQPVLTSRIKILAGMDTSEHQKPSDGHIVHVYGNRKLDFRVASMPVQYGEVLVIRCLNAREEMRNIAQLGMTDSNEQLFLRLIHSPSGMLIATGPMNSGKSTTLYAALQELNDCERHIMTLEDPVEQQLHGINQIEVREKSGLTFARGLRSMLRMDADCIMIGEARDVETAQISIRAALTGHLLLTTLHARDSCSALYRLLEMGIPPYLLAATAEGIIAQRLVRRLCPHCMEPCNIPADSPDSYFLKTQNVKNRKYYRPVGCNKCHETGFNGRIALHEILALNGPLKSAILEGLSMEEFQQRAIEQGLRTMLDDGLEKAELGLTTLGEIRRVLYGN